MLPLRRCNCNHSLLTINGQASYSQLYDNNKFKATYTLQLLTPISWCLRYLFWIVCAYSSDFVVLLCCCTCSFLYFFCNGVNNELQWIELHSVMSRWAIKSSFGSFTAPSLLAGQGHLVTIKLSSIKKKMVLNSACMLFSQGHPDSFRRCSASSQSVIMEEELLMDSRLCELRFSLTNNLLLECGLKLI